MDEHSDTWAFSWMPAIEDFVDQAARRADAARDDSGSSDEDSDEEGGPPGKGFSRAGHRTSQTGRLGDGNGDPINSGDESDPARSGRKRRRTRTREGAWSRRALHPPSYNETLLADKAFHNPHASETMADAFDVFRPASFLLNVGADDRPWGGAAAAAAAEKHAAKAGAAATAEAGKREEYHVKGGEGSGSGDRSWFYDTVRDRQNRLWADTRVRKGVELARKGQHQVRAGMRLLGVAVRVQLRACAWGIWWSKGLCTAYCAALAYVRIPQFNYFLLKLELIDHFSGFRVAMWLAFVVSRYSIVSGVSDEKQPG